MRVQIFLEFRMVGYIFLILGQRRILGKVLRDVHVTVKEFAEAGGRFVDHVTIHAIFAAIITSGVFGAFIASFLVHEGVGVLLNFFAHFRVLLQVRLQVRMALHELLVVYE